MSEDKENQQENVPADAAAEVAEQAALAEAASEVAKPEENSSKAVVDEPNPVELETEAEVVPELEAVVGEDETEEKESPLMSIPEVIEERKLRPEVLPHAFVVMPFGIKKGFDGTTINFNAIYQDLIKPALVQAGFEPFRADEATTSGDILTDMFQELLLADMVIADLSIDNANVYYELGIRHAFKKRGIVHIQSGRAYMPFDIFNVRTIPYHTTEEGVPDPEYLDKDIQAIARITRDTWATGQEAIHSPVFNLLTGLEEPDQKTLRTPLATGFWREYNEWKQRVTISRRQKRIGDILLLTEEITNPMIKEEAVGTAGKALADMGRNELALEQYRKGLELNTGNLTFRRQEAFHLNRLGRIDEAIVKLEALLDDVPGDTEAISYLGRIYKETWTDSWNWIEDPEKRLKTAFESYHWLIKAFDTYVKGYRSDLNQYYPGVNAVTLGTTLIYLADRFDDKDDPDPDIQDIRETLPELQGALEFALETFAEDEDVDYWTLVSLAELRVLNADKPLMVTRGYRKALIASRRNQFFLQAALGQLEMLKSINMRPEFVQAGIDAIHDEMHRLAKQDVTDEQDEEKPEETERQVFLFEGYTVDPKGSRRNLFPSTKEDEVRAAITAVLDKYNADDNDLAFTAGLSAGTELIFAELCAERGIHVEAHLPLADAPYVRDFVSPYGDKWVERFYKVRNHPLVDEKYQEQHLGKPKDGDNLYERNNRWALYSSLLLGIDKVRLIAFWNGKSTLEDDQDVRLVKYMVDLMRDTGGVVEQINPEKLLKLSGHNAKATTTSAETSQKPKKKTTSRRSKKSDG
jgi:tetratricopeptide (TPR) repeat protein